MNPRPMGPIDTSSQSLMCLLTPQSPNPSGTARSLSKKRWFFRYVKRDTLTWRRVRARGNVVLQQDIRLCKCYSKIDMPKPYSDC